MDEDMGISRIYLRDTPQVCLLWPNLILTLATGFNRHSEEPHHGAVTLDPTAQTRLTRETGR